MRHYFDTVFAAEDSGKKFAVNLEHVWRIGYATKEAAVKALTRQKHELEGENRYSTKRAAKFLGCTPGHMQKLHARGLPYEKGRPNQYRLTDLRQHQLSQQVAPAA